MATATTTESPAMRAALAALEAHGIGPGYCGGSAWHRGEEEYEARTQPDASIQHVAAIATRDVQP